MRLLVLGGTHHVGRAFVEEALGRGDHVHIIPGTTSTQHLEDNFAAASVEVPTSVLEAAGELINEHTVAGHRYHDVIRPTIDTEEFEPA